MLNLNEIDITETCTTLKRIRLAVKNTYEYTVLSYLMELCGKEGETHPSYLTLAQGLMSRSTAVRACDYLEEEGYITRTARQGGRYGNDSNNFTIHLDAIHCAILKNTTIEDVAKIAKRQRSLAERKAITKRMNVMYPELAHESEGLMGNPVYNGKTGEKLNNIEVENG